MLAELRLFARPSDAVIARLLAHGLRVEELGPGEIKISVVPVPCARVRVVTLQDGREPLELFGAAVPGLFRR